ncbi:unnamed protein product, partial [Prorocentrum cordatum]
RGGRREGDASGLLGGPPNARRPPARAADHCSSEVHAIQRRQAWPGPKSAQEWRTDHLGCATGTWTPSLYPDGDSSIFVAILAVPGALRSRLRLR